VVIEPFYAENCIILKYKNIGFPGVREASSNQARWLVRLSLLTEGCAATIFRTHGTQAK